MEYQQDILSKDDIKILVDTFYKKLLTDEVIGHYFNNVVELNFDEHMPVMYDFWATVLLDRMDYKGNIMMKHIELNKKEKLVKFHFERWANIWNETIDDLFTGEIANKAKEKAKLMKELMLYKINKSEQKGFIL